MSLSFYRKYNKTFYFFSLKEKSFLIFNNDNWYALKLYNNIFKKIFLVFF